MLQAWPKIENKFQFGSLFELTDDDNSTIENNSDKTSEKLNTSITNIFKILDIYDSNFINFENFFVFFKYLRTFDILNKLDDNKNSVISSKKLNGTKHNKL